MSYRILASLAVLLFLSQHAGAQRIGDALLARPAGSHRIDPAVTDALEHDGAARVIVVFAAPAALAPRTGSHHRAAADSPAAIAEADRILESLGNGEFRLSRRFRSVSAFAGTITPDGIAGLLDDPAVLAIGLDRRVEAQLAESVPLMNLDVLHDRGLTGAGVTVAIPDTGYDSDHPDLSDDLVGERCFCTGGCCPDASGSQSGPGSAEDDNGHGTSVAGVVTSKGVVAPTGGAPDASIVAVKVLSASGGGFLSDVIAGLDWIAVDRPDVQIVNLSLATTTLYEGDCDAVDATTMAFSAVIGALTARGVTVFAATGNAGSSTRMPLPACIAGAVSVAGVWDSNFGGPFNLGPCVETTTAADQLVCSSNADAQTDLAAPAGPMTAPRIGGGTGLFFGASYAAPGAASCAAVLLQYDRALSPGAIEAALESSSTRVPDLRNGLDYPRVDCAEALDYIRAHTPRRTAPAVSSAALAFLAGAFAALGIFLLRTGKYGAKRG